MVGNRISNGPRDLQSLMSSVMFRLLTLTLLPFGCRQVYSSMLSKETFLVDFIQATKSVALQRQLKGFLLRSIVSFVPLSSLFWRDSNSEIISDVRNRIELSLRFSRERFPDGGSFTWKDSIVFLDRLRNCRALNSENIDFGIKLISEPDRSSERRLSF